MIDAEQLGAGSDDPGGVERRDQREEAARGVREAGHLTAGVAGRRIADGEGGPRGAQRDGNVTGGQAEAEGGAHVVAGPRCQQDAVRGRADDLRRSGDPRHRRVVPQAEPEQVRAVRVVRRGPVARAGCVTAVGGGRLRRSGQPPGEPVVREQDAAGPLGVLRLGPGEPAQLGDGEAGHRDQPDGVRPGLRAAQLFDQVLGVRGGARVVPQEGGPDDGTGLVEHDHAVLLTADGQRGDALQESVGRLAEGCPPGLWRALGPVGVGRAAGAHVRARVGVTDDDLDGLGGGVDPGDERHGEDPSDPSPARRVWDERGIHPGLSG